MIRRKGKINSGDEHECTPLFIFSDESSSPQFVLPAGPSSNNHTVQITIEVKDRFGDTSEQTLSVSVKVSVKTPCSRQMMTLEAKRRSPYNDIHKRFVSIHYSYL